MSFALPLDLFFRRSSPLGAIVALLAKGEGGDVIPMRGPREPTRPLAGRVETQPYAPPVIPEGAGGPGEPPRPLPGPLEERALVARCRRGDQGAWREVYAAFGGIVMRFLRRRLGPGHEAADLVQEVFVQFFLSLDGFREEARISTWLYRIAARVVSHHVRTEVRHRRRVDAFAEHCIAVSRGTSPDVAQVSDEQHEQHQGAREG